MLNSKIGPRAVVGYGVKIFHPSPPNYVTRSPGYQGYLHRRHSIKYEDCLPKFKFVKATFICAQVLKLSPRFEIMHNPLWRVDFVQLNVDWLN